MPVNTAPRRVVFLTPLLTRANGGSSTALDIAECLRALGIKSDLVLTQDSTWLYRLSWVRRWWCVIRCRVRCWRCLDLEREIASSGRRSLGEPTSGPRMRRVLHLRRQVKLMLKALNLRVGARRARGAIARTSVVIDAGGSLGANLRAVRAFAPRAQFVMNHNGSLEAFEEHFLKAPLLPGETNRDRYLRYIGDYELLMFQSAGVADEVTDVAPSFKNRNLVVSPSCREAAVLGARHQGSPFAHGTVAVVVVASVQRRKGQEAALRDVARLRSSADATLHFVGPVLDREYAAEIRCLAQEPALDDEVFVHGPRADYGRYLAHASLVLQPSSAEGVSRVMREAMLLERPIVAYAIPSTNSVLTDERDALLVPRGDVDALAEAMRRLVSGPDLAQRLGAGAGATYLRNHSRAGFLRGLGALMEATHLPSVEASAL